MPGAVLHEKIAVAVMVVLLAVLLGSFTTSQHVRVLGADVIERGFPAERHRAVLEGTAGDPWQYRVLSTRLVEFVRGAFAGRGIPYPLANAFVLLRTLADACILALSYALYRRLGLTLPAALTGMAMLAWGISYSHHDADMQLSTYLDVSFYLLAAIAVLSRKAPLVLPVAVLAALNRETSLLIPFLLLVPLPSGDARGPGPRRRLLFAASLAACAGVIAGLRLAYGAREPVLAYGHAPGFDMLGYNLLREVTWRQLVATLGLVPLVAMIGWRRWPATVQSFFWVIVPAWFVVHAFAAVMAETRLLLVPQALVFIPGALATISSGGSPAPARTG